MTTVDDSLVRVLLAVLCERRPTWATCIERTGLSSHIVNARLHQLRSMDLVAFEDHKHGTLRATVRIVAMAEA